MLGLMQDWPLLCHRIIDHAAIQHGERPVVTRSVEGPIHTTNYAEIRKRALKLAQRLEKDGVKFSFTFMARDPTENKFLVIYQQDLKDCGIEMKIELKDWSAWMKEMDAFNFDMTWCSFSGRPRTPSRCWRCPSR